MFSEFIQNSIVFQEGTSKKLRAHLIPIMQGLGLPTPQYCKTPPWGYRKENNIFIPIERDLIILLQACEMADTGHYTVDSIVEWVHSANPETSFERRNFFNIKRDRPAFPELRLPVEERIKLVHRPTTATA